MKIFVLWSGGLDSTYLLQKLSQEGHEVSCGYVSIQNNLTKIVREKNAIERIKIAGFLRKYKIDYHDDMGSFNLSLKNNNLKYRQVLPWLTSLVDHVDSSYDQVALGYVMNDDMISYINDIRVIWDSFNSLTIKPLPELTFPLSKTSKIRVWHELDEEVRELVTWCESPRKLDHCRECPPCKRMELYGISFNRAGVDDETDDLPLRALTKTD